MADASGMARLRVPYATAVEAHHGIRVEGPYRVATAAGEACAHVIVEDVRAGRPVVARAEACQDEETPSP
jgi:hypothetical protein